MRSTSLGFALGICLLSLYIPIESGISDSRIPIQEKDLNPEQEAESPKYPGYPGGSDRIPCGSDLFINDHDLQYRLFSRSVKGYRRITAKNVLDHETRKAAYDLIGQNPGIDLTRLSVLSEIKESTLRYHLDRMDEEDLISVITVGKSFHYFQNHNQYSDAEQQFYSRFSSGTSGKILQIIRDNPGITRRELADRLIIASPTVTRSVQQMAEQGYIRLEKQGKYTRHYLPGQSAALIHRLIPA